MVREVEKSGYLLTILDIKILNSLVNGAIKNKEEIAKEVNSTSTTITNNLQKLDSYKLINWKKNETPKPHKISLNKIFQNEVSGILKIFKEKL